jgi:hypothetical protein
VLPQVVKIIGSVVAPTTLLTALLLYFGRRHAQGLFRVLRVPFTVFELTPQDYLIRSADGLFVPVTIVAGVAVLACWAHYLLVGSGSDRARAAVVRAVAPLSAVVGIALVVFAAVATVSGDAAFPGFPEGGGLSLAIGVLLLAYAVRLIRTLAPTRQSRPARPVGGAVAEWTAIFVLVGVGLFWAVNSYAIGVGTSRAHHPARREPPAGVHRAGPGDTRGLLLRRRPQARGQAFGACPPSSNCAVINEKSTFVSKCSWY